MKGRLSVVLVAVALAGCAADGGAGGGDDGATGPGGAAGAGGGAAGGLARGILAGVVVDQAVVPVPGADVTLSSVGGAQRTATTDDAGAFAFYGVADGQYTLRAFKHGYVDATTTVGFSAQDGATVSMIMDRLLEEVPYVNSGAFKGMIECSFAGSNWCGYIQYATGIEIAEDDTMRLYYDEIVADQAIPDWLQFEMVWEPQQELADGLWNYYMAADQETDLATEIFTDFWTYTGGNSPLVMWFNATMAAERAVGTKNGIGMLTLDYDETTFAGGAVISQPFEEYWHVFYNWTPPEGWRFSLHGDPVVPA